MEYLNLGTIATERPVKPLPARIRRVRRTLKMLHHHGKTWEKIGELCHRSGPWACRVAGGDYNLIESVVEEVEALLPPPLWETYKELDERVLDILVEGERHTANYFARCYGTTPRTIRGSIKRLREKGHNITASLAPPRGYRLEEEV